jgi:hypothetical protein
MISVNDNGGLRIDDLGEETRISVEERFQAKEWDRGELIRRGVSPRLQTSRLQKGRVPEKGRERAT